MPYPAPVDKHTEQQLDANILFRLLSQQSSAVQLSM